MVVNLNITAIYISTTAIYCGILTVAYIGTGVNNHGIFIKFAPGAYVIKLLTAIIYGNVVVIPSFCVIK
jgi:hypothetical protein